jgi:hypothetical protein
MRLSFALLAVAFSFLDIRPAHAQLRDSSVLVPRVRPVEAGAAAGMTSAPAGWVRVHLPLASGQPEGRTSTVWLATGGVVGGGLGLFTGMLAGALIDQGADTDCREICFGPGLIIGGLLGEAAGLALGVHVVNGGRGSLALDILTSTAILGAGLFLGQDSFGGGAILIAIPVAQIVGTITMERRTQRYDR